MKRQDRYTMLTTGSVPIVITTLAVPTIISMLVTSFYSIADTFFVGQIDTQSTAAVGVVLSVMFIIQASWVPRIEKLLPEWLLRVLCIPSCFPRS